MSPILNDLLVASGLFVLLLAALEGGFRLAARAAGESDTRAGGQVGAVQGAILGLLGLLLGFSFAAAGARFLEKQDLIVAEANAIGTASLRADLLDEPYRSELRATLQRYTEHRVQIASRVHVSVTPADAVEIERLHARMWRAAIDGVAARPASMVGVLPPVNEVIDLHATRIAASQKHLPILVMVLLVSCSVLAVGVIGYGSGLSGSRRAPLTVPLALLIGTSLWITIDLDHPRAGLMQLSDAPLRGLRFDPTPP